MMDTKTVKILFIEDNPGDARFLKELLKDIQDGSDGQFKFKIAYVDHLLSGLEYLSVEKFDIIFLDLLLPDSKGLETLESVREKSPALPVLVLTGISDDVLKKEALSKGADDFIEKKKLNVLNLETAIRNILNTS
jgi:CheY-like chemotaxis protein